ncbi:MAG: NADH-quinone oxidoreductase subunit C [Candidatus Rokubacteria bacterium]|nr:NADH-quinone oxidoreductase subunit C [Candidatus Rokubacteria bacterium]
MAPLELARLTRALVQAGAAGVASRAAGLVEGRLPAWEIPALADRLRLLGAECQFLAAADTRARAGDFTLAYVFAPPQLRPAATVLVSLAPGAARFPSLATRSFAASRFEREIHDLVGLVPTGHPELHRLALHQFWPEGYYPLRRDVAARTDFVDEGQPFPFRHVEGEGLFEITVGPVHAGIIEPGHFRFSVEGETIVNLETRLGFVHKGTEKLFETLPFARTVELAERVSGDTSFGHALAYCQALEALTACEPPPRARWLRVLLLELERLYNHVADVGMIVNDTGYAFGHAHCFRIREELLRLDARVCGHRLLRGAVVPGGVTGPVERANLAEVAATVERLVSEFAEVARLCLDNTMVLERLQGTGRLTSRTAKEMQVVGLVARASGIDADLRRDAPFAAYGELGVRPAVYATGDVWARTMVRVDEARESARLIRAVAGRAADGPARVELPPPPAGGHAFGLVEAWRGPVWYWVLADGPATLARVKVVDPSFRNWPALEYAVLKNIVPDFPLCNKSFNLSYSGNDL